VKIGIVIIKKDRFSLVRFVPDYQLIEPSRNHLKKATKRPIKKLFWCNL